MYSICDDLYCSVDDKCHLDGCFFNDFSQNKSLKVLKMKMNSLFFKIFSVLFLFAANKKAKRLLLTDRIPSRSH